MYETNESMLQEAGSQPVKQPHPPHKQDTTNSLFLWPREHEANRRTSAYLLRLI